jgi:regulator of protease activity HflC (stomatin/prohibitin superfamily)
MEYLVGVGLVVVVIVALTSVRIVPQGFALIVERLGRYQATLQPGLNLIAPLVSSVRARVDMRETVVDVPSQSVITRDNAAVTADGVLFYQVLDPRRATYEVTDLRHAIQTLAMTTLRTVMGSMDLDELLSQRETINAALLRAVDEATSSWGVRVTRIELRDITPPADIVQAMGRQLKAERDRRAQILEADADKESQIRIAQGRLEAAKLEAEARERLAQAEAQATRMVSEAVAAGSTQALGYFLGQKYVEALKAFADSPNQKTMVLPVELAGLAGTLAGLGEVLRAAAPDRSGPDRSAPPADRPARRGPWSPPDPSPGPASVEGA